MAEYLDNSNHVAHHIGKNNRKVFSAVFRRVPIRVNDSHLFNDRRLSRLTSSKHEQLDGLVHCLLLFLELLLDLLALDICKVLMRARFKLFPKFQTHIVPIIFL